MKIRTVSKTQLFLLEFLVIIVMLALAATVSLGLLAKAKESSQHSEDLTYGVLLATSAAERFTAGEDLPPLANYAANGRESDQGEYAVTAGTDTENGVVTAEINVSKDGTPIYSLTVARCETGGEGR